MRIASAEDLAGAVLLTRKQRGWTQAELADHAQVSRDLVNRLENGSGRIEVAKVLGILAALGLVTLVEPGRPAVDLADIGRAHRATS
ncbi:MAG: helix-turn-helix domain-containing protein [bacterium]